MPLLKTIRRHKQLSPLRYAMLQVVLCYVFAKVLLDRLTLGAMSYGGSVL